MKRTMKRMLSLVLACILLLGTFSAGSAVSAEDTGYKKGDVIEFGSYPQSRVTDEETLAALFDLRITWQSYGYYAMEPRNAGSQEKLLMQPSDFMKYADVTYNGERYRAVRFTAYRPDDTRTMALSVQSGNQHQVKNGFSIDTTYWFRYDPIRWRVLDPAEQLVVSESVLDAQPFSNTMFGSYIDPTQEYYALNYEHSSIRAFLTSDNHPFSFLNTAFSEQEQDVILTTVVDNRNVEGTHERSGDDTEDKVFLLSLQQAQDGWNWAGLHATEEEQEQTRAAKSSDYAKCQGVYSYQTASETDTQWDGCSGWILRTGSCNTGMLAAVSEKGRQGAADGMQGAVIEPTRIFFGVRPAMRIDLTELSAEDRVLCGGNCGEHMKWQFNDGDLMLSGYGTMTEYSVTQACPWDALRDQIRSVTVQDDAGSAGVSSISAYAFKDCPRLTEVYLSCVRKIGKQAFAGCDRLDHVTSFADVLAAGGAFPSGKSDLLFYCLRQSVQQTVQAMGYSGVILAVEDQILSVPGVITVNAETTFNHIAQWISFFSNDSNAKWIRFDKVVFEGVSPSVAADRNHSFMDSEAEDLTLSDFYCRWSALGRRAFDITAASILTGLQKDDCAAFFADPTFGRHIQFGSYPQTRVKDSAVLDALNGVATEWTSYGYYSGDGNYGSAQPGDFMQFTDVTFENERYRGVKIVECRPVSTNGQSGKSEPGAYAVYTIGTYWFRWEPISWRVLDEEEGLLFSENVLDYQPFHYTNLGNTANVYTENGLPFPGDYSESSIRDWLNSAFCETAFSAQEQSQIVQSLNETPDKKSSDQFSNYSIDKVFLPSLQEITAPQYGFSPSAESKDPARGTQELQSQWTDYSESQGLLIYYTSSERYYAVRTATNATDHLAISANGTVTASVDTSKLCGIRLMMRVDPALLTETPDDPPVEPQQPVTGTCGENVQWAFDEESGVLLLSGTGAMDSLGAFTDYGYSVWKDDIQFVAAADGVTSIGAHAFEECPILEEVILGEDVTVIGEAAFLHCSRLKNVTLLSETISANGAFPDDRVDWMLIHPKENVQAVALAKWHGVSGVPISYEDEILSFGGTITVHDGFAYSYLPMLVQRYGSAQKVYFNRLVFADVRAEDVSKQDYIGSDPDGCLTMFYVEVSLIYVSPDGEQREVTYDEMIDLLQSGDYRAFKLRVSTPTGNGYEKTQEEIIYEKLEEILPFMPRKVLRLVSKAINFIVSIFKKK